MAYSDTLAARVDEILVRRRGFDRRKMFGGVGYLMYGNMCVGFWKEFLIARLGKEAAAKALKRTGVKVFDITGKPMKGWVMVDEASLGGKKLAAWIDDAIAFVRTLERK